LGEDQVVADFNRIVGEAEALLKERPVVATLSDAQIRRMAESYYATMLAEDEQERREGTGPSPSFRKLPSNSMRPASNTKHRLP